jgi:hypothetical protein
MSRCQNARAPKKYIEIEMPMSMSVSMLRKALRRDGNLLEKKIETILRWRHDILDNGM